MGVVWVVCSTSSSSKWLPSRLSSGSRWRSSSRWPCFPYSSSSSSSSSVLVVLRRRLVDLVQPLLQLPSPTEVLVLVLLLLLSLLLLLPPLPPKTRTTSLPASTGDDPLFKLSPSYLK